MRAAPLQRRVGGQENRKFARQVARLSGESSPLLATLPPALVTGVVAKAEEDRERQAEQREGCCRDMLNDAGEK
jgi:hypothetical protein